MLLLLIGIILYRQELKIAEIFNTDIEEAKLLDFQLQLAWTFIFAGSILLFLPLLTTFMGRQIWYLAATVKFFIVARLLLLNRGKFIHLIQTK